MPISPVAHARSSTTDEMNACSWRLRRSPQSSRTDAGSIAGRDDPGPHRVLEVVADVRDAVRPGDDLALRRARRRAGTRSGCGSRRASPRTGSPARARRRHPSTAWSNPPGTYGVNASSLACPNGPCPQSWPSAIASVERDVQPARRGDARGDLRHLERVGQPGALVVLGEHEHLRLARQPPERRGAVQDPVPVPLEARADRVGLLRRRARCPAPRARVAPGASSRVLQVLAGLGGRAARSTPIFAAESAWARRNDAGREAVHRRGPARAPDRSDPARSMAHGSRIPTGWDSDGPTEIRRWCRVRPRRARRARRRAGPAAPGTASTTRSRGRPRSRSAPTRGRHRAHRRCRA